eukprot:3374400-Rhodomonas_salina.1
MCASTSGASGVMTPTTPGTTRPLSVRHSTTFSTTCSLSVRHSVPHAPPQCNIQYHGYGTTRTEYRTALGQYGYGATSRGYHTDIYAPTGMGYA